MIKIEGKNFRQIHIWIDRLQQRMPQLTVFNNYYDYLNLIGIKREKETNYFIFDFNKIYEIKIDEIVNSIIEPNNLSPAELQYFDFRLFEIKEMIDKYKIKEVN